MNLGNTSNRARIFLAALVLILGAFWAGARFGPHGPSKVEAVPLRSSGLSQVAARDSGLTEDESINVRIYRQASPAVANILTKATEYDFFIDRKSTRLNSSHGYISYAVFCLKKKKNTNEKLSSLEK